MIKLKELINERKFGEPLPTLKSEMEKHQSKNVVTEDVETAVGMFMKRWDGVVKYWKGNDDIWDDSRKIPKIIVKYKRQWEKIVDKMDREVRVKKNESIERALSRFKKKVKEDGFLFVLKERQYYTKPSEERREKKNRAKRRNFYNRLRDEKGV